MTKVKRYRDRTFPARFRYSGDLVNADSLKNHECSASQMETLDWMMSAVFSALLEPAR